MNSIKKLNELTIRDNFLFAAVMQQKHFPKHKGKESRGDFQGVNAFSYLYRRA